MQRTSNLVIALLLCFLFMAVATFASDFSNSHNANGSGLVPPLSRLPTSRSVGTSMAGLRWTRASAVQDRNGGDRRVQGLPTAVGALVRPWQSEPAATVFTSQNANYNSDVPESGAAADATGRMMTLMLQLGVILFAARLGGILFERLRLPVVLGELFSGVLIGPEILGALPIIGFPHGLFYLDPSFAMESLPVSPELYGICALASIVLLFIVGLETDIKMLMRYSLVSGLVGTGGVVLSFLLGNLATVFFSPMLLGRQLGMLDAPCILMGVISTATSVGITARVLSDCRKLESPEGVTILAGAVVDDVLGIIMLAVGMGVINATRGGSIDWWRIANIAGMDFGLWIAVTAIGLIAAQRISAMLKIFRHRSVIAVMALGLALLLAGFFEGAGLAMIIGAYVMGLSLSTTDLKRVIQERLQGLHVFLVPVFFAVMGMLVDIRALGSPVVILFGVAFALVGAFSKIVGCGLPALASGFTRWGALRIGIGMLPRGEVTLIVAGAGLSAGMLSSELFSVVVCMTFFAALAAPPALVAAFRHPAEGLRHPRPDTRELVLRYSFPNLEAAAMLMQRLSAAFDAEGFYVHTLDSRERSYQVRKDDVVIGFRQQEREIVFVCDESQQTFIKTAVLEVLTDMELLLNALRKPLDPTLVALGFSSDGAVPARGRMDPSAYLDRRLLFPEMSPSSKDGAIAFLVDRMAELGLVRDRAQALNDVLQRERVMSTGMQDGIAIPHARSDSVEKLVCAVGLCRDGIDFTALDGQSSRIVILTLAPRREAAPHMQFMASVANALNAQGRGMLLACRDAATMFAVLSGARREAASVSAAAQGKASLAMWLKRPLVTVNLHARTKSGVLDELLALLSAHLQLRDITAVRQAILEREEQMSTGMQNGVAIPHARTDQVGELVCALGLHKTGIAFGALDGKPSHIFVLTLSPASGAGQHIQFMAVACRFLDASGRERLLQCGNDDELWVALTG